MSDGEEFNRKYAEIGKLAEELLDMLASDLRNMIPTALPSTSEGQQFNVQFFDHLRAYHGWEGTDWLQYTIDGGGEMVSEMHDAEHENAEVTSPVGIEDLVIMHRHPREESR